VCLIIDANCFGSVLNPKAKNHEAFKPVHKWILSGKGGRMIMGGTKYRAEVKLNVKSFPVLIELKRKNRIVSIPDDKVDRKEEEIKNMTKGIALFNDQHIVALLVVSGCCVVCTKDKESDRYIKDKRFYPKGMVPKIYRSAGSAKLCCEQNVAPVCR
jgi:hypothetical protein